MWRQDEIEAFENAVALADPVAVGGRVQSCTAHAATVHGLQGFVGIGDACRIARPGAHAAAGDGLLAEVVALVDGGARLLAYDRLDGVTPGTAVRLDKRSSSARPHASWKGRVLDAMGQPIDGGPPLLQGERAYPIDAQPIAAHERALMGPRLPLGVRAMDLFTPCRAGQRLGIFAGSGVGKSSMVSMLARGAAADVMVIGLIGERGRELQEFLQHTLGPEGRARSVVIAATSDTSAMTRRRAAHLTLTVAEYFRDQGLEVLCMLDSVTRFAMALREIYLAAGEPPTTKGYPPGVFAELPRLLERAGPGVAAGRITGLFTVLVEGDDTSEPVADAVRGILDGHVVLDRKIAEAGRFPAIDVLQSISRSAPGCYTPDERALVAHARTSMQSYAAMAELVELGAYRAGANPALDEAIRLRPALEALLAQDVDEPCDGDPFAALAAALRP
ncbi:MAG: FliI/YscN family ATPase [Geminicoccaceae bacterium]|nr:FliI/YscN family ATPase [Geminicoccaceae bacterium]